uniref:Uncharacterized protein n=1 Tax=Anguilla anguilla TaxID=7936 RepID=A0A0E9W529_ANGAN
MLVVGTGHANKHFHLFHLYQRDVLNIKKL